jgi:F-type H+-transporting ATPase subunit b
MTQQRRSRWRGGQPSRLLSAVTLGVALACNPALALAQEAAPTGIAALGFNLPGLIAQLINFGILLFVMRLFLYKPVLRILDERRTRIEEGLNRAELAAVQASASQDEARRVIDEARGEGRELVAAAQDAASRLRTELEERARTDANQIVTRARDEIQNERDQAIEQLRREFADLTIAAAEQVIGQSLDRAAHQRLIDETLVNSDLGQRN